MKRHLEHRVTLHPVIAQFQRTIEENADLFMAFHQIFEQIPNDPIYRNDPTGKPQVQTYQEMLEELHAILTRAPEFGDPTTPNSSLAGSPINALLNWPMNTTAGQNLFTRPDVNAHFNKILTTWAQFLSSPKSRYVITADQPRGWLTPAALTALAGDKPFESIFVCDPSQEHWGFMSWDDFFARHFRPTARPIHSPEDESIIVSACEAVPYKISYHVKQTSSFWIKDEPYSLSHMLHCDPLTDSFIGGTVYQAFLNGTSYHRWHSPLTGHIVKIVHVPGTYFVMSPAAGFEAGAIDTAAPANSQAFVSHLATRTIIFLQADNQDIGLMAFMGIGMTEVSSCEATVTVGQRVKKGEEIGSFYYGGSSYCLIFRSQTKVIFDKQVFDALESKEKLLLNTSLARVSSELH